MSVRARRAGGAVLGAAALALAAALAAPAAGVGEGARPPGETVLVRAEGPDAAGVRRALGARGSRPLSAGWRAYEVPGGLTLAEARRRLRGAVDPAAVEMDAMVEAAIAGTDPLIPVQWALGGISAPAGWGATALRAPVTVAVLDSAVDIDHPDLAANVWRNPGETPGNGLDDDGNGYVDDVSGWDFHGRDPDVRRAPGEPAGDDAHGTHVAGTIAAVRGNGIGVAGVAENARIMPLRFLSEGSGTISDAILAIDYAAANGARVINASWGGRTRSRALCDAVARAGQAGVLVVAAAGNEGVDNDAIPFWPASCAGANVVAVAATTSAGGLAGFSNRGLVSVHLGAPGQSVLSTLPGGYGYSSGTSMAAPHVAGVAAALWGERAEMTPARASQALLAGGSQLASLGGRTLSGARLDMAGALAEAAAGGPDTAPPAPFSPLAPADGAATALERPALSWAPALDAEGPIASYRVLVDGVVVAGASGAGTSAQPAAPLPEGARRWRVVAVDFARNQRSSPERTLVVDRTPPPAPLPQGPAEGATVPPGAARLAWGAVADPVSGLAGYRVIVDGALAATAGPAATSADVLLEAGPRRWRVEAVDRAGNSAAGPERLLLVAAGAAPPPPGGPPPPAEPLAPAPAPAEPLAPAPAPPEAATAPSPAALRAARPIALAAPARIRPGTRASLRLTLARPGRVVVTVTRRGRQVARLARRLGAGRRVVRLGPAAARRMRAPGVYVVAARLADGAAARARLVVRGR